MHRPRVPARPPDGLGSEELLRVLSEERALSAGAIEAFADCSVKWLVEKLLNPTYLIELRKSGRAGLRPYRGSPEPGPAAQAAWRRHHVGA